MMLHFWIPRRFLFQIFIFFFQRVSHHFRKIPKICSTVSTSVIACSRYDHSCFCNWQQLQALFIAGLHIMLREIYECTYKCLCCSHWNQLLCLPFRWCHPSTLKTTRSRLLHFLLSLINSSKNNLVMRVSLLLEMDFNHIIVSILFFIFSASCYFCQSIFSTI